ncbi:MAG TPA: hypothetical protein QGF58_06125 [Myxococcota bacterium]|nr:hypothetical protein [Myxococcota bacterium]
MELKQKGEAANVGSFKQLLVTMKWTTAADFDLAACYQRQNGQYGLIYFGDLGNLNDFPYIQLSGDEGQGDTGGDNEEQLRITKLDDMKSVWLICWDYGQVQKGAPARFADSDVSLNVMDDSGTSHDVRLDAGTFGNTAIIAAIENSAIGSKITNMSKAGTLKGLTNLQQLLDIINS